jgi:hypothetical protein
MSSEHAPDKKQRRLMRRKARARLITRQFSLTALGTSLVVFLAWLLLFRIIGVASHTVRVEALRSSSHAAVQRSLIRDLEADGGTHCAPETLEVHKTDFWVPPARADAYDVCGASGSGVQTLAGSTFRSEQDLRSWVVSFDDFRKSETQGGICEGSPGQSEWSDRANVVRGPVVCYAVEGQSTMVWANLSTRTGFVASSRQNGIAGVFDWWVQHVRGGMNKDDAGEQTLKRLYGAEIRGGLNQCHKGQSALANAVLWCDDVYPRDAATTRVDSLNLYEFATSRQLDAFYSTFTKEFNAPTKSNGLECGRAALVATIYGEPTEGRCFGFAAEAGEGGALWLLWTHDKQHVAALMSSSGESLPEVDRAWDALY